MKIKNCISELAIFGGAPLFNSVLHVGQPNIGNRERLMERINKILDNRWLTNNGPYVQEFEKKIAEYVGIKHCIAICNATVALEIAARALDFKGEVIVPSMTFIATAHSLQWQEITPIFCDIAPNTHNIDPQEIERLITPRTTGIVGVHLWGRPCDVDAIEEIARRHRLKILYDAAHAFGCSYHKRMIGGFGDAEVFSFHATKFFNTFEGGAIVTGNDELAEKTRLMRNFGFAGLDNVIYIGTNGKMSEVSAAMGLTSLESLDEFIEHNRRNYHTYRQGLAGIYEISLLEYDENELGNYQYIVFEIDQDKTMITRDNFVAILHAENLRVRRYFFPGCHQMEPYKSYFPNAGLMLRETENLVQRVLSLPTGLAVNENDINNICQLIRFVLDNAGDISIKMEN